MLARFFTWLVILLSLPVGILAATTERGCHLGNDSGHPNHGCEQAEEDAASASAAFVFVNSIRTKTENPNKTFQAALGTADSKRLVMGRIFEAFSRWSANACILACNLLTWRYKNRTIFCDKMSIVSPTTQLRHAYLFTYNYTLRAIMHAITCTLIHHPHFGVFKMHACECIHALLLSPHHHLTLHTTLWTHANQCISPVTTSTTHAHTTELQNACMHNSMHAYLSRSPSIHRLLPRLSAFRKGTRFPFKLQIR